jgi:hypothetical protein
MKNQKQLAKSKKPIKQTEPETEEFQIKQIPAEDPIAKLREKYFLKVDQSDTIKLFLDVLLNVFSTEGVENSSQMKEKHLIKALFDLQKYDVDNAIMDLFERECVNLFKLFKELSNLTDEDRLNWIIEATLNVELDFDDDDQTTLPIPE